jgi:uncharacterized protein YukE
MTRYQPERQRRLNTSSNLTLFEFRYGIWLKKSNRLNEICEEVMATTAEIKKLTEHAGNFKRLMKETAKANEDAAGVAEQYGKALDTFRGHMDSVKKQGAELQAAMAEMGNAIPALEDAFQDDKPAPTPSKPSETAQLHEVRKTDAA